MKPLKRFFCLLVVFALILSSFVWASAAGLSNFTVKKTYIAGTFTDVPSGIWYEGNVIKAYELDLVNGKSKISFDPDNDLIIAEAIKLAACLHSIYHRGFVTIVNGSPFWYQTYVDYCLQNRIIQQGYGSYDKAATRAQVAAIFASALPREALAAINTVEDDSIPDVKVTDSYGPAVYLLYKAGILTGSDALGTYNPDSNIKRSEMATIVSRMADVGLRMPVVLGKDLPGEGRVSAIYLEDKVYINVTAENSARLHYRFGSSVSVSDPSVPAGGKIAAGESVGSAITLLPVGVAEGKPVTIDLTRYYSDLAKRSAVELSYINAGRDVWEHMKGIKPYIVNGSIADSAKNAQALILNNKISAEVNDFLGSGIKEYINLGKSVKLVRDLVESLRSKTPGYVKSMGLTLWNAAVSDCYSKLQTAADAAPGRIKIEY